MQLVSNVNNLHEISKPIFFGKMRKILQNVVWWKFYLACQAFFFFFFSKTGKHQPFHPFRPIQICLQTGQVQMWQLVMSCLIWIYTVCHSVIDFWLKPLFATMGVSRFRDGRVHVRNLGVKGLIWWDLFLQEAMEEVDKDNNHTLDFYEYLLIIDNIYRRNGNKFSFSYSLDF